MDGQPGADRRSRLRQYQVQLLERMQAARNGDTAGVRELGVLIGGRHCLLALTQIGEIVAQQPLAPVPLTRDWYLGLANIRGNLTGVIDLARYRDEADGVAGGTASSGMESKPGRFITLAPRLGFNCALLAEQVLGLRQSAQMQAVGLAADHGVTHAAEAGATWGRCYDDAEGRCWTLLDLAQLVREPRFLQPGW